MSRRDFRTPRPGTFGRVLATHWDGHWTWRSQRVSSLGFVLWTSTNEVWALVRKEVSSMPEKKKLERKEGQKKEDREKDTPKK